VVKPRDLSCAGTVLFGTVTFLGGTGSDESVIASEQPEVRRDGSLTSDDVSSNGRIPTRAGMNKRSQQTMTF
jgi:hypothetical protein